jgi:hypothetical protein
MTKIILLIVLIIVYQKALFHLSGDEIWSSVGDLIVTLWYILCNPFIL